MAYYSDVNRHSSRNHFVDPPSIFEYILAALPVGLTVHVQRWWRQLRNPYPNSTPTSFHPVRQKFGVRTIVNLPNVLILIWILVLLWGERWVFKSSVAACAWDKWERWPRDATPHHLVFVADPQLVDPHTYPTRPWPLSTFTILHTDNYLKRAFTQVSKALHPDTVFFLGDLFDGGREWSTRQGDSSDTEGIRAQRPSQETDKLLTYWKSHYGDDFWLQEYNRFVRIFFEHWNDGGADPNSGQRGRKIIATLPGNHDLGFGAKIKIPVRDRFQVYFGEGNRVDVVGNHTFVSVDSVSLSAGSAQKEKFETGDISGPVEDFLGNIKSLKRKAVDREVKILNESPEGYAFDHQAHDLASFNYKGLPSLDPGEGSPQFPTVLLTHVPLYRDPGTPCGPHREHWPPSTPPKGQTSPVIPDERNAIPVARGFQYQNVLSDDDSVRLVATIGDVVSVFSGDDHDYCEIVHSPSKNNAREITVKSMSWAMGVRHPGFEMLSLWNPIDAMGNSLGTRSSGHGGAPGTTSTTVESHLCLLPDQLGIFIRYLILLCITLLALVSRAILVPIFNLQPFASQSTPAASWGDIPLLPTFSKDVKREAEDNSSHRFSNSSTSSTTSNGNATLAARSTAARTRSISPASGSNISYGYGLPPSQARYTPPTDDQAGENVNVRVYDDEDWARGGSSTSRRPGKKSTPTQVVLREIRTSIWRVAWVVGLWYFWLVWRG